VTFRKIRDPTGKRRRKRRTRFHDENCRKAEAGYLWNKGRGEKWKRILFNRTVEMLFERFAMAFKESGAQIIIPNS
jgi:hypothetical protein